VRKRKGNGFEREVVRALQRAGLAAGRVPLSGELPGYEGDVSAPVRGVSRKLQCWRRRRSFSPLYEALDGHYGVVVRDDGRAALIVLPLGAFAALACNGRGGSEMRELASGLDRSRQWNPPLRAH
jgi:hypothetical protein